MAPALMTAVLLTAIGGCGTSTGSALDNGGSTQGGLITIRTGTEVGIDFAFLRNITKAPITIRSVRSVGTGIGTVVRLVETKIASGPSTAYIEDPPVFVAGHGKCVVQQLRPVHGHILRPGLYHVVTVWTVVLGVHPGRYQVTGVVITYTQAGTRYQQTILQGYHGRVTRHAPLLRATQDNSRPCLHLTHLLKGTLP